MKLTQTGFKGGLVDSPKHPDLSCASELENVIISKDGDLLSAPGVEIYSLGTPMVPTQERISAIESLGNGYVLVSNRRVYFLTENTLEELKGPEGGRAFNAGNSNSIASIVKFNNQLHITLDSAPNSVKVFIDGDTNGPKLVQAGLPSIPANPTFSGSSGSNNYIYAFTYKYEYKVGNNTFVDISAPLYVEKTGASTSVTINDLPELTNDSDSNYDVENIKVQIYRTTNNGTVFYLVGEVTNGTNTFTDTVTDAVLVTKEGLYTNGGVRPNNAPPTADVIFSANDVCYYLRPTVSGDKKSYRALQSVINDPDSVPNDFIIDFPSPLVGGGVVGRSPVFFTDSEVVRIDGVIDEAGAGLVAKEVISNTVGGISQGSIVRSASGLYFAGTDSFYFTNGFSEPTKLAKKGPYASKIDGFYKDLVRTEAQRKRIIGAYDNFNGLVFWACQESDSDNDVIYVYHESHDSFTKIRLTSGVRVSAIKAMPDYLLIGDAKGYIFRMSFEATTYPRVDINRPVTEWIQDTIIYRWKSVYITGGDSSINKWFQKINLQGRPETNLDLAINSYTNGETDYKSLHPLSMRPSITWGDPSFIWGNPAFVWGVTLPMNQTRRFSHGRIRARQRQLEFTNAYTLIESRPIMITINATTKVASLSSGEEFGGNLNGYFLRINGTDYEILSSTVDSLTLLDPESTLINGSYEWGIYGYPKGQRLHLEEFSVEYEPMSDLGTYFHGETSK